MANIPLKHIVKIVEQARAFKVPDMIRVIEKHTIEQPKGWKAIVTVFRQEDGHTEFREVELYHYDTLIVIAYVDKDPFVSARGGAYSASDRDAINSLCVYLGMNFKYSFKGGKITKIYL